MTGSLQKKNGKYYAVVNYFDEFSGKRKQKWINTGLSTSGNNVRKAQKFLRNTLKEVEDQKIDLSQSNILFTDYIEQWLELAKMKVDIVTWQGYNNYAHVHVIPYFKPKKLTLNEVTPQMLQDYYMKKLKNGRKDGKGGLAPATVKLHNVVIQQTLKEALKKNLIPYNPADRVTLPSVPRYEAKFYDVDTVNELLEACEGEAIKPIILLTVYYGLRRSEVMGLKWNAIDFKNDTLRIQHTVVQCTSTIKKDKTKKQQQ